MSHVLRDLLAEPSLPADVERRLARASRDGDVAARRELVRRSLRLVAMRVRALGFTPAETDDALQEGVVALLAAVGRFDPDRGARLATFAWPRIGGALLRWRERDTRMVPCAPEELPERRDPAPSAVPRLAVDALLSTLSPLERSVVCARHGLGERAGPCTWDEVGMRVGLSASTARRVEARAMSRLRRGVGTVGDRAPRQRESIPHSSIGRAFDC
ncbi:hypothetical protein GCM10009821_15180 [Aeromicrobium halocynthiae]|uniref:RNA polymerase sigma-70 domain-containing protein n=1 Tax=Aeromicrobium halocynthiae TaxID=560557 RepID=A0ABN2VXT0_9ACTN